jgi:hypothetical protein
VVKDALAQDPAYSPTGMQLVHTEEVTALPQLSVLPYLYGVGVMLLNRRPATSVHSRPSEFKAVAATWARAVCSFASSRHHNALEPGAVCDTGIGIMNHLRRNRTTATSSGTS